MFVVPKNVIVTIVKFAVNMAVQSVKIPETTFSSRTRASSLIPKS